MNPAAPVTRIRTSVGLHLEAQGHEEVAGPNGPRNGAGAKTCISQDGSGRRDVKRRTMASTSRPMRVSPGTGIDQAMARNGDSAGSDAVLYMGWANGHSSGTDSQRPRRSPRLASPRTARMMRIGLPNVESPWFCRTRFAAIDGRSATNVDQGKSGAVTITRAIATRNADQRRSASNGAAAYGLITAAIPLSGPPKTSSASTRTSGWPRKIAWIIGGNATQYPGRPSRRTDQIANTSIAPTQIGLVRSTGSWVKGTNSR